MTDLGELETFLGLQIKRDRDSRVLTLCQHKYIDRILLRHGMQNARPAMTPLNPHIRLPAHTNSDTLLSEPEGVSLELYESAVGSLMYAMLGTRPDLAYAVGLVSQFNHSPKREHWMGSRGSFVTWSAPKRLCCNTALVITVEVTRTRIGVPAMIASQ